MAKRHRVHLFFRKPNPAVHFSIERLFAEIAAQVELDSFEVKMLVCPFSSRGLLRRAASILWAALHQGDVNHVTGDIHYLALLMSARKTILTIHDSASMNRLSGIARWVYWVFWIILPIRRVSIVTVVSESSRRELSRYLSDRESRKLSVVPNCVTVPIFNTVAPGGARSNPVILLIGTRPHKNIWRVVEAVTGMQVILRIVGEMDAALRSELERRSVMYECYVQVDDRAIVQLYRTADVVAFVPTYEGFGLPILEAQAAGVPLVTSARSPMREVAGLGACLVDPESVEEIRFAIAKLISDEAFARQIVEAGFRNVPKYNSASIAAMYKSLYESLLQEST